MADKACCYCSRPLKGENMNISKDASSYLSFYVYPGPFGIMRYFCAVCAPALSELRGYGVIVFDAHNHSEQYRVPLPKYVFDQAPWVVEEKLQSVQMLQKLVSIYGRMFSEGKHSDLRIEVQGEVFQAHRAILATRSPVFDKMFACSLQEANSGVLRVDDISPPAMKLFLHYMYTNELDPTDLKDTWPDLLGAAQKYDVAELKRTLEEHLGASISLQTAIPTLRAASLYDAQQLESACLECLASQWPMVLNNVALEELMLSENIEDRRVGMKALKYLASKFSNERESTTTMY